MAEVVMPRLSDSMEEGTVLQWLKQIGDEVAIGDELVEIETDKANMAYESDVAGTLAEILVEEGETVAIGEPIARIGDSGGGTVRSAAGPVAEEGGPAGGSTPSSTPPPPHHPQTETVEPPRSSNGGGRPKASPVARRIAKEQGLDLSKLQGSGPGGRIVKADVERAASSAGGADSGGPRTEAKPPPAGPPASATGPARLTPLYHAVEPVGEDTLITARYKEW
jgi:pyruvate dehydrogenase E2 component (dihydrolipoamide acetyltransferase)